MKILQLMNYLSFSGNLLFVVGLTEGNNDLITFVKIFFCERTSKSLNPVTLGEESFLDDRQALTQSRTDICVDFDPGTSSKCPRTISLITECLSFTASVLR